MCVCVFILQYVPYIETYIAVVDLLQAFYCIMLLLLLLLLLFVIRGFRVWGLGHTRFAGFEGFGFGDLGSLKGWTAVFISAL